MKYTGSRQKFQQSQLNIIVQTSSEATSGTEEVFTKEVVLNLKTYIFFPSRCKSLFSVGTLEYKISKGFDSWNRKLSWLNKSLSIFKFHLSLTGTTTLFAFNGQTFFMSVKL